MQNNSNDTGISACNPTRSLSKTTDFDILQIFKFAHLFTLLAPASEKDGNTGPCIVQNHINYGIEIVETSRSDL